MKDKHKAYRISQCIQLAEQSTCPRRKFGALIVSQDNTILSEGYNGGPRRMPGLCDGHSHVCERDLKQIPSGTHIEVGCIHAEMNAICNAARTGVSVLGAVLFVSGEPCLMCAKLIHQAGIARVVCVSGGYMGGLDGVDWLTRCGVNVEFVDGPKDPRTNENA